MSEGEWYAAHSTLCGKCNSPNVYYELVEDYEGHEDSHYQCEECGHEWWIDGADY